MACECFLSSCLPLPFALSSFCCEFPLLCTQFVVCLSLNNLLSPLSFSVNSCSLTFTKSLSTYGIVILPYFQYCPGFSLTFKSFILVHWFLHVICKKYPTLLTFCAHFVLSALLIEEAVFFSSCVLGTLVTNQWRKNRGFIAALCVLLCLPLCLPDANAMFFWLLQFCNIF